MDSQIRLIATWITGDYGVLAICALIFLWAELAFLFFRRRIVPIVKGVNKAIVDISAFESEHGNGFKCISNANAHFRISFIYS